MPFFGKKTVPRISYDTLQQERDDFEKEVKRLQAQVAVLVIDEDAMRRLILRVFTFLGTLEAGHKVGVARQKEIDVLIGEARSAGLIDGEDKEKQVTLPETGPDPL